MGGSDLNPTAGNGCTVYTLYIAILLHRSFFMADLIYLNVYAVTRHYGGPEEGGWWFNAGEPLASIPLANPTDDQIEAERTRLQSIFADHAEGDIYSVNGGVKICVYTEDHLAASWPTETPYY